MFRGCSCAVMGVVLSLLFAAVPGEAAVFTLTDANSTAVVDSGTGGMTDWTIDGIPQLARQWFWYRVGNTGGESNLGSLPLNSGSLVAPDYLQLVYQGASFTVEAKFILTGGAPGAGGSDIAELIKVYNAGATPLDFHFFQFCNLHLAGSIVNDSVEITGGNTAGQTLGSVWASETVLTPLPAHHQVGLAPSILASLDDASPTTLSDLSGPMGPGDLAWSFEWDVVIQPGKSFQISKDKQIVPEPTTLCLLSAGVAAAYRRRRR